MAQRYSAQRSRAYFGVLLLLITTGLTILRARAATEPLETLTIVTRMHADGKAGDGALANAQYHGAHARRSFDARWSLTGYATHSLLGAALGLSLIFVRRRTGAV
jgi:hypothetical protein